jgi:hypothetical protein
MPNLILGLTGRSKWPAWEVCNSLLTSKNGTYRCPFFASGWGDAETEVRDAADQRGFTTVGRAWPNVSTVAAGAQISQSTLRRYLERARLAGIDAAKAASLSDDAVEAALFPPVTDGERPVPDWAVIDASAQGRHASASVA